MGGSQGGRLLSRFLMRLCTRSSFPTPTGHRGGGGEGGKVGAGEGGGGFLNDLLREVAPSFDKFCVGVCGRGEELVKGGGGREGGRREGGFWREYYGGVARKVGDVAVAEVLDMLRFLGELNLLEEGVEEGGGGGGRGWGRGRRERKGSGRVGIEWEREGGGRGER